MKVKCFICKGSKVNFLLKKDGHDLWNCKRCGLNFVWPQPSNKDLQKVYSLSGGYSHSSKGFDKDAVSAGYEKKIDFFVKNNVKKVLDVGCASGSFVHHVKRRGMVAVGIDLDRDSIKFGKKNGLDLRHGRLEDFKFKAGSFDAINLGDIVEHVKDPENFLKECLRILKKGGVLIISTPNTNSLFPKMTRWVYEKLGVMWSHPTPPYHLFDFSDENLKIILEKNGVEILDISYSRIPLMYSIYHTGYFDEMRGKMKGTSRKDVILGVLRGLNSKVFKQIFVGLIYGFIFILSRLSKKGGQMIVWGRKK